MGTTQSKPTPSSRRRSALIAFATWIVMAGGLQACGGGSFEGAYEPDRRIGQPHNTYARAYPPAPARADFDIVGIASWYGKPYHGRRTASGEVYNMYQMTAAHPSLPFGTRVLVTNLENGRSVVVKINDRGPFVRGRVIDLSRKAAGQLGFLGQGLTRVGVRVLAASQG